MVLNLLLHIHFQSVALLVRLLCHHHEEVHVAPNIVLLSNVLLPSLAPMIIQLLLCFKFVPLQATYKAPPLNVVLPGFVSVSELSKSIQHHAKDNIQHQDNHDQEERQIENIATHIILRGHKFLF